MNYEYEISDNGITIYNNTAHKNNIYILVYIYKVCIYIKFYKGFLLLHAW